MSGKRIDIEAICELSFVEREARYPVAPFLVAMREKSGYQGGKQECGYLVGNLTSLARAVDCKPETVRRIHERLLALDGGGNAVLKALPSENPRELVFFSERMKNTLDAMSEKKGVRLAAREARAAGRREAAAKNKTLPEAAPPAADDDAGTGAPPPPADSVEAKRSRLDKLKSSLSKYGNAMADSDRAELEAEIQQLETELNIFEAADVAENADSRAADGAGSAGTVESEERTAPNIPAPNVADSVAPSDVSEPLEAARRKLKDLERDAGTDERKNEELARQKIAVRELERELDCARRPAPSPFAFARPVD